MRRTNRIDNQFIKLSKMKTTTTILPAATQNISAKDAATVCTSVYAREGDKTKFFEEACAFRAEAVAGRRRAGQLIEAFRMAVAAVHIQAVARRMLARARQRSLRAKAPSQGQDGEDKRRTRRLARRWLSLAKRLRLGGSGNAGGAVAQTPMADQVTRERARARAALQRQKRQQRRALEQLRSLVETAAVVQIQTAWRSTVQRRQAEQVWRSARERREAREARERALQQEQERQREERALTRQRRELATLRLQACGRGLLARRRHRRYMEEMGRASLPTGLVRLSVGEEPAWLLEAENLLAESMGATNLVGPEPGVSSPRREARRLRSERIGALTPTQLAFPSPPNTPSLPDAPHTPSGPSPPLPGRPEGAAWRSGGRQRRLFRDLRSELESAAAVERQGVVAAVCAETRAFAYAQLESVRSEAERQERQLYREREEARQLAEAIRRSATHSGGLDEGQQAAFVTLCDEVGVVPSDVQFPLQVPMASDRAQELHFARKCRTRRISLSGRKERWDKQFGSIRYARTMAEIVMAERFGVEVRREEYKQDATA